MKFKKRIQRRLLSFFLCIVLLITFSNIFLITHIAALIEEDTVDDNTPIGLHEYHQGIVDGGIYYIRNYGNNEYLNVLNAQTNIGSKLTTSPRHAGLDQQFKLKYMGNDTYQLIPMNAPILHIAQSYSSNGTLWLCDSYMPEISVFQLKLMAENTYIIYASVENFTSAACIENDSSKRIIHSNFDELDTSHKPDALWALERVDTQYENYDKFYIYNPTYHLYLNSDPSLIAARVTTFDGTEAQQWKQTTATVNSYYFSPMNAVYNSLNVSGGSVTLRTVEQLFDDTDRQLLLENATVDANGNLNCNIAAYFNGQKKYLNVGGEIAGETNTRGVIFTNKSTGNDIWVFNRATTDSRDPQELTLNFRLADGGTVRTGTTKWFSFWLEQGARYKIELSGQNVEIGDVKSLFPTIELERKTYNGLQILDMVFNDYADAENNLGPKSLYYVPVIYTGSTSNPNTSYNFTIRIRQLTFTAHSDIDKHVPNDPTDDVDFANSIEAILDSLQDMDIAVTHRHDIDPNQASTAREALTNYLDFNSDYFMFSGHGESGKIIYEMIYDQFGNAHINPLYLLASELPSMDNNELSIWNCCNSASTSETTLTSTARTSILKGSTTAIGFNGVTYSGSSQILFDTMFTYLSEGMSVQEALGYACEYLMHWAETHQNEYPNENIISICSQTVDNITVLGNVNTTIFPVDDPLINLSEITISTNPLIEQFKASDYELVIDKGFVKKYVKVINGIITDDYFYEFYKNEQLISTYFSPNKISEFEVAMAELQLSQYATTYTTNQTNIALYDNIQFMHINNELYLVRTEQNLAPGECVCQAEYTYYNAITNEVLQ